MYVKTLEELFSFILLTVSYFYWILISIRTFNKTLSLTAIIVLILIISVILPYTFLIKINFEKKFSLMIGENKRCFFLFLMITAFSAMMFISFFMKHGGSELSCIHIVYSLFASIFIFLYPLKNVKSIISFNLVILICLIFLFYYLFDNIFIKGYYFALIDPLFSSSNGFGAFALVSFAHSFLSINYFSEDLFNSKVIKCICSLIFILSLLIAVLVYSRSVIGSFAIMITYLLFSSLFIRKTENITLIKLLLGFVLFSSIFLFLNDSLYLEISKYFNSIGKFTKIGFLETSRYMLWRDTINEIVRHTDTILFGEPVLFSSIHSQVYTWHPHNSYIEMIRCSGVFSLFFFFVAAGISIIRKRLYFFEKNIIATSVILMLLSHMIFEDVINSSNYLFLVFWAMLECCRNKSRTQILKR